MARLAATIRITCAFSALVASRHPRHPVKIIISAPRDALMAMGRTPKAAETTMPSIMRRASGAFRSKGRSAVASSTRKSLSFFKPVICSRGPCTRRISPAFRRISPISSYSFSGRLPALCMASVIIPYRSANRIPLSVLPARREPSIRTISAIC